MTDPDCLPALALALTPGLGNVTLNRLWEQCRERDVTLEEATRLGADTLEQVWGLTPARARAVADPARAETEVMLAHLRDAGHDGALCRWVGDAIYPSRLRERMGDDAPFVLWGSGEWAMLGGAAVAISGTRQPSPEGAEAARRWAEAVAARGLPLITGLARGVDQTATRAALDTDGPVIGVLAEGLFSDRAERWIAAAPPDGWFALSEHPTVTWNAGLAMTRNRLIAALADAVIIIEAAETGGTMNQASVTRELGVPLGVVDLPAPGNQKLLRRGTMPLPPAPTPDALDALL